MFSRARLKLTAWYAGVLAAILLASGLATYVALRHRLRSDLDDDLRQRASIELARVHVEDGRIETTEPSAEDHENDSYQPGAADVLVWVLDPAGGTLLAPTDRPQGLPAAALLGGAGADPASIETQDGAFRVLTVPVTSEGRTAGYLQLAKSEQQHLAELQRLAIVLSLVGIGGVLLATAGGFLLTRRTLSPIEGAMQRQREFVADASHELRTPLALLRGNAEVALTTRDEERPAILREMLGDIDHMSALVGDLLTTARIDAGTLVVAQDPVDLGSVAGDVAGSLDSVAQRADVRVRSNVAKGVVVEGDETRLRQLVTILVDNGVRYNHPGGTVDVSVARNHSHAELEVRDTGEGIPGEALPRVFERFFRADASRSAESGGTGLGLSIAKGIVEAHHGRIRVESKPGAGTTVQVSLPLARG